MRLENYAGDFVIFPLKVIWDSGQVLKMQKWIEIQLSTHFILDFWLEPNTVARTPQYKDVPVLEEDRWPSKDELGLDESQYEALKIALTKEVAVIQGPPGTGKTFIGLKVWMSTFFLLYYLLVVMEFCEPQQRVSNENRTNEPTVQ